MIDWIPAGERLQLFPVSDVEPTVLLPYVLIGVAIALVIANRRRLQRLVATWKQPKLEGPERTRLESTQAALAELISAVDRPKDLKGELQEPMRAYRVALHRRAQLRRYLGHRAEDLEATIRLLEEKRDRDEPGFPRRRLDAALSVARTRVRARARAMDEIQELELELVHLENRMWATVEGCITRSGADERYETLELLRRLKADEETRQELESLERLLS